MAAVAQPSAMREGDWMCASCGNHNFASRTVCNRCGGPKSPPAGQGREGDWMCPSCGNHNYANRMACNRCGAAKPGALPGMMPVSMKLMGQMGGGCAPSMSFGALGLQPPPPSFNSNFRPGDWTCAACGNHNFASREVCNKCGGPKTAGSAAAAGASYGALSGGRKGGSPAQARFAPYPAAPQPGLPNVRPGDWICPACNNHNFASRESCNRCGGAKPVTATATGFGVSGFRAGDWMCPACNNHNYASKTACNKCGEPRPEPAA